MRSGCYHIIFLIGFSLLANTIAAQETPVIVTYYDIDSLLTKEKYSISEDKQLIGQYESYFASGGRKTVGWYTNNVPDSSWQYFYENGNPKTVGALNMGVKSGEWKHFYENGNLHMKGKMEGEKRIGRWTFYYENGKEKSIGQYKNNKKEQIWNYFYEDGNLKAQAFYEGGSGDYKELYPSGALKMEGYNSNGKSTGKWKFYYETGEQQAEGFFKNGSRSGNWKYFHTNGQVSATGNYSTGRKDGLWKYYYPDGKLRSEGIERDGQKEGFWKLYYESGETKASGNFDAGSGKYFEFYENGKQKASGNVVNGKNEGKWTYYNEAGQEEGFAIFRRGVGKYQGYYENGALKMEGTLENSKRVGIWKLFNTDGSLAGYYKPVYENDRPIFKTAESFGDDNKFDKPGYRVKKKKSRYFNPKVNEFKGYIFSTNPLLGYLGFIPLSIERYKQERLGYELTASYHRNPFFRSFSNVDVGEPYYEGLSFSLRQKLYSEYGSSGMFYFGHQVSYQQLRYNARTDDPVLDIVTADDTRYSYDLLIGTRWLKDPDNGGITWDVHLGIGIGNKTFTRNYIEGDLTNSFFNDQDEEGMIFPIRFGLTIGYIIPRKRNSPVKIKS